MTAGRSSRLTKLAFYSLVVASPKIHNKTLNCSLIGSCHYSDVNSYPCVEPSLRSWLPLSSAPPSPMSAFPFSLETHHLLLWGSIPSAWVRFRDGDKDLLFGYSCACFHGHGGSIDELFTSCFRLPAPSTTKYPSAGCPDCGSPLLASGQ